MPTTKNRIFWAGLVTLLAVLVVVSWVWWFLQVQNQRRGKAPWFPLRTDPRPPEWTADKLNNGLPYRRVKGEVYVLVWEVIEDTDDWTALATRVCSADSVTLVLKKFHRPTESGGHKWLLARVNYEPKAGLAWSGPRRFMVDELMPKSTDAQRHGYEFYNDLPTDEQLKAFLDGTHWTPWLGSRQGHLFGKRTLTTTLTAGGIDRKTWKTLFGRDVPTELFPELEKATGDDR